DDDRARYRSENHRCGRIPRRAVYRNDTIDRYVRVAYDAYSRPQDGRLKAMTAQEPGWLEVDRHVACLCNARQLRLGSRLIVETTIADDERRMWSGIRDEWLPEHEEPRALDVDRDPLLPKIQNYRGRCRPCGG